MRPSPFWKGRPLAASALFMALGILAGRTVGFMPGIMAGSAALGALLILLLSRLKKDVFPGVVAVVFSLSALYAGYAARPYDVPAGGYVAEGYVSGEVVRRDDGSFRAALRDVEAVDMTGKHVRLGRVYWTFRPYDDEEIDQMGRSLFDGDRVTFAGTVYRPSGRTNPWGFDFSLYLRQNGFDCAVSGCSSPTVVREADVDFSGGMLRARLKLSAEMDRIFGDSAPWPQALLLGERDRLSEDTRQAFSDLGIAHILAVSGLHVGLIGALLLFILRKASAPPRLRLIILAGFLLFYCALLDFSHPVCRASILLVLGEGRHCVRRSADGLTFLSASMIVILLISPLSLFSAGFRMTFCAVLGITILSGPISRALRRPLGRRTASALGASWGAAAGVAIPLADTYHSLALLGLVLSPPVCLAMGVLLPAYLAIFAVGCVWLSAGQFLAGILHACLSPLEGLFSAWSARGVGVVPVPAAPGAAIAALCAAAFVVSDYTVMKRRARVLCAAAALIVTAGAFTAREDTRVRYLQLSAGQGDCALILDGRETVVIDCGEDGGDLRSWLLSEGRQADTVVLTHLHADHCGGLIDLMKGGVGIGRVILPEGAEDVEIDALGSAVMAMLRERGIPISFVRAGDVFTTDRAHFEVLWPEGNAVRPLSDANDYSLTFMCEAGGVKVLFTGDLSGTYETYAARDADILKAAHHGSASSTGERFLDIVTPKIAVITCRSGMKLPSEDTLGRLREAGCVVYRTDETGCLTFYLDGGGAEAVPYLAGR